MHSGIYFAALVLAFEALSAMGAVLHVRLDNPNPVPPYADWSTAATNIQDAVDLAQPGDGLLVTNGVYTSGGRVTADGTTNCVAATKGLIIQSVNGPEVTILDGGQSMRCLSLADGAVLAGFTLRNGKAEKGGGVWCATTNVLLVDCRIMNNTATFGGGVYAGSLSNCAVTGNSVGFAGAGGGVFNSALLRCTLNNNATYVNGGVGAGAVSSTLIDCTLAGNICHGSGATVGGGAADSVLYNCTLTGNTTTGAGSKGGGAFGCTLVNCRLSNNETGDGGGAASNCLLTNSTVSFNRSDYGGGGVAESTLYNCVLTRNYAKAQAGGAWGCILNNCTLYANSAQVGGGALRCTLNNSINYYNSALIAPDNVDNALSFCATPDSGGVGTITNAPLFVDEGAYDLRLQPYSPCINAGNNELAVTVADRDGNPRIVGGRVDIGAYEEPTATPVSGLPERPAQVSAALEVNRVKVGWSASFQAASYTVRRATTMNGPYANIAVGLQATTYADLGVDNGGVYYYLVAAVNEYGESVTREPAIVYVVDHFTLELSGLVQTASVPFAVSIRACDAHGTVLRNFAGAVFLSGAGDLGPLALTPVTTPAFSEGQWSGEVTIGAAYPDTNIRLTTRSNGVSGVSAPFRAVPPAIQRFTLTAEDLIYNPFVSRIYATIPARAPSFPDQLVVIDPTLGRIESAVHLGDDPAKLALSDDGRFLYIGFMGLNVLRRMDLRSYRVDLEIDLGLNYWLQPFHARDIAVLPGTPRSLAVTMASPGDLHVAVFDDGIQRSNTMAVPSNGSFAVAAASATTLFSGGYCYKMTLDASGVADYEDRGELIGFTEDIKYQGGRLYASGGRIISTETMTVLGQLPPSYLVEPDMRRNRIFTLEGVTPENGQPTAWTLYAYAAANLRRTGNLPLPGTIEGPGSLIRWGTNGLALRSSNNRAFSLDEEVYLIRTDLVVAAPHVFPPLLTGGAWLPSGIFQLRFNGDTNLTYVVWGSTNLTNWTLLGAASAVGKARLQFLDTEAGQFPQRFYRAGTPP